MPPKKKIVKTVRKIVPKSKTSATDPTSPSTAQLSAADATASASAVTTTTPTVAVATSEPAATKTPEPAATEPTATETPEPAATEPTATETPEPAATETPEPAALEPAATETLEPASLEPAATETLEPASLEPAATETLEPAAAEPVIETETPISLETEAPTTTQEPSVPAPASAKKPATRIVKKIVKKIIVKRVPKGTLAAKKVDEKAAAPQNPSGTASTEPAPRQAEAGDASAEQEKGDERLSEKWMRRKTEIFIGGLSRSAKEEDLRKMFGKAGEIVEVRMMMDNKTGKNKGYAFVRYAEPAQAKKAVSELAKVEVCGKLCGAAALEGKDTIFLGNIDKKWKKEDVAKLLKESGIEKIDSLTLMTDPSNTELNRGFAFLELETNKDAHLAYKKLQQKDIFGKGRDIKVSWAEPFNEPDEEEMQKVKSVYADGIPSSWNEDKVREAFKKFGEIERIVFARNIQSTKRNDFAFVNYTTRESALSCIQLFDQEELTDNGSKVTIKVSLAKPGKDKQNKGGPTPSNKDKVKEKPKAREYAKVNNSSHKGKPFKGDYSSIYGDKKSSTTTELLHVLREQAAWKQDHTGYVRGPPVQDYTHAFAGGKRLFSELDDAPLSDFRDYPRRRLESSFPVTTSSSYLPPPHGMTGSTLSYYQRYGLGYGTGTPDYSSTLPRRQGGPPYGSNPYY